MSIFTNTFLVIYKKKLPKELNIKHQEQHQYYHQVVELLHEYQSHEEEHLLHHMCILFEHQTELEKVVV